MGKILTLFGCLVILMSVLLSGCNTAGCTDLRSSVPRADFYASGSGGKITVDSLEITGVGVPGDSVLYGPSDRISQISLPMPPEATSVQWRIAYMQSNLVALGLADTISLDFERSPWFAGEECGAMYKYRITRLRYTTNIIDSVALTDSTVINIDTQNLAIYFRTSN